MIKRQTRCAEPCRQLAQQGNDESASNNYGEPHAARSVGIVGAPKRSENGCEARERNRAFR